MHEVVQDGVYTPGAGHTVYTHLAVVVLDYIVYQRRPQNYTHT
jgi:hypothetical protein